MYKYLEALTDRKGSMEREMYERIANASWLYHCLTPFMRKKEINNRAKVTVFGTVFRPC